MANKLVKVTPGGSRVIPATYHLPGKPEDGIKGLLGLIEIFGADEVFGFLSLAHSEAAVAGEMRARIAISKIVAYMKRNPDSNYFPARSVIAREYGYTGTAKSNFNRVADRGRDLLRADGDWPFDPSRDRD
jgi:hypothetical protein